jgi:hypothetical protein
MKIPVASRLASTSTLASRLVSGLAGTRLATRQLDDENESTRKLKDDENESLDTVSGKNIVAQYNIK